MFLGWNPFLSDLVDGLPSVMRANLLAQLIIACSDGPNRMTFGFNIMVSGEGASFKAL